MRSIHATLLLTATLLLSGSGLIAADEARAGDFNRSGGYVGINGAYGANLLSAQVMDLVQVPAGLASFGNSAGLNARLGVRFLKIVALEAQYEWMDGIDLAILGTPVGSYKPNTLTANLKLYLPISFFQPYILGGVGVGFWKFQSIINGIPTLDSTGFAGRAGLGLDLMLTENIGLNVEGAGVLNTANFNFTGANALQQNLYYFSVSGGFIYRF